MASKVEKLDQATEYPFDFIDLVFMLLAPSSTFLLLLCIIQYTCRRSVIVLDGVAQLSSTLANKPYQLPQSRVAIALLPSLSKLHNKKELVVHNPKPTKDMVITVPETTHDIEILPNNQIELNGDKLIAYLVQLLHLLVIGQTNGGKTVLIHALATSWAKQGHMVIVCDPDAAPGLYPGCKVYGAGDNYAQIEQALGAVQTGIKQRREQRAKGKRTFKRVYVIIDEAHDVVKYVTIMEDVIQDMARRGRKINMILVLGVQDKQVKTLRLEGQSQLRRNFTTVQMLYNAIADKRSCIVTEHEDGPISYYDTPILEVPDDLIPENNLPETELALPDTKIIVHTHTVEATQPKPSVKRSIPHVAQFLIDACNKSPQSKMRALSVYQAYVRWCNQSNQKPMLLTAFGLEINKYLSKKKDGNGYVCYLGVALKKEYQPCKSSSEMESHNHITQTKSIMQSDHALAA